MVAFDWRVRSYVFTQLRDRFGERNLRHERFGGPAGASEAVTDAVFLTIAIPVLNEERYIAACLRSLLAQIDPLRSEIIVIDGGSEDSTLQIVSKIAARHPVIRTLHNPRRIQSAAINLAARSASPRSTLLMRADAHAEYPAGFVATCLRDLVESHATSVVVPLRATGCSCFQRAVAAAQNGWIGNGGSRHRSLAKSGFVTHGHHALFDLRFFRELGGYDESFTHNEDAEYDHRSLVANGAIWMTAIPVRYFPRDTIKSLARQYYSHGRGRARTLFAHKLAPALRQLLPPAILLVNSAAILLALAYPWLMIVPSFYGGACCLAGVWSAIRSRELCGLAAGPAAVVMHMSWAAGFTAQALAGRSRPAPPPGGRRTAGRGNNKGLEGEARKEPLGSPVGFLHQGLKQELKRASVAPQERSCGNKNMRGVSERPAMRRR
jgi:succinoglycan biosynthesis protein ExoA